MSDVKWKIVPIDPTAEMITAAYHDALAEDAVDVYAAMLAAAPPVTITDEMVEKAAKTLEQRLWLRSRDAKSTSDTPEQSRRDVCREAAKTVLETAFGGGDG